MNLLDHCGHLQGTFRVPPPSDANGWQLAAQEKAFSVFETKIREFLPREIHLNPSIIAFHQQVKIYLFQSKLLHMI